MQRAGDETMCSDTEFQISATALHKRVGGVNFESKTQ